MDPAPMEGQGGAGPHEGRRSPVRAAGGLLGVLVALVAVLWLVSLTGDGARDEPDSSVDEHPEIAGLVDPPTTSSPIRDADEEGATEAETAASAEPFSPLGGRLAYLSRNRVAVVDLATGSLTLVPAEPSGGIASLDDFELLTDGSRTVALSLDTHPPRAVLVASSAVLVPAVGPLLDYWVITRPDGPNGSTRLAPWHDYGVLSRSVEAPAGSELVVTGESGVLVLPPVGGTFRPTINGFEIVTDRKVLAAAGAVRVEQSCDEQLRCAVAGLDLGNGSSFGLPEEFVAELAELAVSPDGRWVLNDTSPAWLFDRHTEELRLLEVGGFGQARWSDDFASVAWLTTDRTPTLVLALLEPVDGEPGWHAVELAGLDADPDRGSSFVLDSAAS